MLCLQERVTKSEGLLTSSVFAALVDEILGSLIPEWTARGVGWSCDHLFMTCLAHADDVLIFADSLENITRVIIDCCASFERAGFAVV